MLEERLPASQTSTQIQGIHDRRRGIGFARQLVERGAQPALQIIEQRLGFDLSHQWSFLERLVADLASITYSLAIGRNASVVKANGLASWRS